MREGMGQATEEGAPAIDPIARLRIQADRLTERAALMREFADAAAPLYGSLSDDQKRRAFLLIRSGGGPMGIGGGAGGQGMAGPGRPGMRPRMVVPDLLDWHG
jgi:hypothetical protein